MTQFVNRGFDQFLNREVAWENYKNSNFEKKGKSYADEQSERAQSYLDTVAELERRKADD